MAKVAVIIPTFNRAGYIATSIDSILSQTAAPQQVIVIDDGSTDNTKDVVANFVPSVSYFKKENGGKPAAINYALKFLDEDVDYLWIFDDDDVALDDTLERHLDVLERQKDKGFSYSGSYRATSGKGQLLCIQSCNPVRPFDDDENYMELLMSSYTGSPAVLVRMSLMRELGGYREDLIRSQDYEIGLRWLKYASAARLETDKPTFLRRDHDGVRGDKNNQFDSHKMKQKWRDYEKKIFREKIVPTQLADFLPRSSWEAPLENQLKYRAYIRRIAFYITKGMIEEAIDDIGSLGGAEKFELGMQEQRYLFRASQVLFEEENAPNFSDFINTLCRRGDRNLRKAIAKGLYYEMRKSSLEVKYGVIISRLLVGI